MPLPPNMAEDDGGWEDEDDMFPPVPDEGDEELQPEPEPEAPELAEATAALCSDAELATTLRVLEALQGEKEVFLRSRRFKKVRYFSRQLTTTLNEIMYDGLTEQEYQTKIIKTRIKSSIKDRMKRRDQDKVEKAKLRAARMSRLQQLQEQQGAGGMLALSAVPDGAVETGEPAVSAATLAAGVGAQSSFAVKAGRRTLTTGRETTGGAGAGGGGALEDGAPAEEGAGLVEDEADDADSAAQGGEGGEEQEDLIHERSCYLCKNWFKQLHHFYDQFCPQCAAVNWEKRHQTADMAGRVALVTGGRVKIGYHVALKLLRCGATTIVTSRFPADAARRFAAEADFGAWGERLHCYGLDLRHTQGVESFCAHISEKFSRLDVLINNACQTIRRPAAYYQHMIAGEKAAASEEEAAVLRPLLKDHLEWVGGGGGGLAQVEAPPDTRSAAGSSDGAEAEGASGGEGGVALGKVGASVVHDSAQMSQMAVHEEDSSVKVAPRAAQNDAGVRLHAFARCPALAAADGRWCRTGGAGAERGGRSRGGAAGGRVRRQRPTAGHTARELLAAQAGGGGDGRGGGGAGDQHPGAIHAQLEAQAADARGGGGGRAQVRRQRQRDGGQVLPVQDPEPPAHQHGQGGSEHDDPNLRRRAQGRRHLHELGGHRLDQR